MNTEVTGPGIYRIQVKLKTVLSLDLFFLTFDLFFSSFLALSQIIGCNKGVRITTKRLYAYLGDRQERQKV